MIYGITVTSRSQLLQTQTYCTCSVSCTCAGITVRFSSDFGLHFLRCCSALAAIRVFSYIPMIVIGSGHVILSLYPFLFMFLERFHIRKERFVQHLIIYFSLSFIEEAQLIKIRLLVGWAKALGSSGILPASMIECYSAYIPLEYLYCISGFTE